MVTAAADAAASDEEGKHSRAQMMGDKADCELHCITQHNCATWWECCTNSLQLELDMIT